MAPFLEVAAAAGGAADRFVQGDGGRGLGEEGFEGFTDFRAVEGREPGAREVGGGWGGGWSCERQGLMVFDRKVIGCRVVAPGSCRRLDEC